MRLDVLTKEDCEQVRLWRNECPESLRTSYPLTKEQQEKFYEKVICNPNSPHRYWGIWDADKTTIRLIGMGGLTYIEWENRQAEISLIISPQYKHTGYGTEAVCLLLDMAFNRLNLELVYGECYYCNPAGIEFWKKIAGADNCRDLRKGKYWKGKSCYTLYFDITKEEFNETIRKKDADKTGKGITIGTK